MTLHEFINRYNVKLDCEPVGARPDDLDTWHPASFHYKCILKHNNKQFSFYFTQGPAVEGPPTVTGVLKCLITDTLIAENSPDFEDFANEFGYCMDSRRAERIYKAVLKQRDNLQRVFNSLYDDLLIVSLNDEEPDPPGIFGHDPETGTSAHEQIDGWE